MPSFLDIFNWDAEDLARAGDKVPHSPDDKECGDHFIPKWKDCHDGDAHRPEPGENPYWTDDNSAEERRERDVPWDTNKPKTREEREKETDWEPPEPTPEEEEEAPAPEPEPWPEDFDPEPEEEPPPLTDEDMGPPKEEGEQPPPEFFEPQFKELDPDLRETERQVALDKWARKDAEIQQRHGAFQPRELHPDSLKNYGKRMRESLTQLSYMSMMAYTGNIEYPGSTKETPGERIEDWLNLNEQLKQWKKFQPKDLASVDELANKVRETLAHLDIAAGRELRNGRLKGRSGQVFEFGSFELRMKQTEFLLDQYENDKFATSNPQDTLGWERLKKSPEYLYTPYRGLSLKETNRDAANALQSITEIPGFRFKGIDPDNMSPAEQKFVENKLRGLELWFKQWKHNPKSGMGGHLAKKLMGGAEQMGPHIDESPLEPNPEAARIIAEISAKAGEENSNDLLWEEFGMSEEWTPTSFQHDYKKAAKKAIVAAKQELGFDIASFAKDHKTLDKMERAAKALDRKHRDTYPGIMKQRIANQIQHEKGLVNDDDFTRQDNAYRMQLSEQSKEARDLSYKMEQHKSDLRVKVETARLYLHESLTQANVDTAAREETIAAVLGRLDQPMWRDMVDDKPAMDRNGKVTRKAQRDFDKLQAHRESLRRAQPQLQFVQAAAIKVTMSRVLGWLHRDLLEGPEGIMLKELNWEAEASFRAHANENRNAIVLDQHQYPSVAAHEFGHHLEFRNRRVRARILDFYNDRTEGVEAKHIRGFEPGEVFKQPRAKGKRFFTEYASKFYGMGDGPKDTELLSLGLEALENGDKFRQILRHDPEHLAIILATIRGY